MTCSSFCHSCHAIRKNQAYVNGIWQYKIASFILSSPVFHTIPLTSADTPSSKADPHWPLGDLDAIFKLQFSISFYWLVSSHCLRIMPWDACHGTSPMISQHWFRQWLGAVRQQAITWANVDLVPCRHMASSGHNELINLLPIFIRLQTMLNMQWAHQLIISGNLFQ